MAWLLFRAFLCDPGLSGTDQFPANFHYNLIDHFALKILFKAFHLSEGLERFKAYKNGSNDVHRKRKESGRTAL